MSRISSSNIVPHSNLEQDGSNLEMQKVQESLQDIEERVFDWQQKEFSKVRDMEVLRIWFFNLRMYNGIICKHGGQFLRISNYFTVSWDLIS